MLSRWEDESEALLRVVEGMAGILNEAGIPRMPARVLAYMLADDADRYTSAALAEGLREQPHQPGQHGLHGRDIPRRFWARAAARRSRVDSCASVRRPAAVNA